MNVASRVGDPILSRDGGTNIVAYWRVAMPTSGKFTFAVPQITRSVYVGGDDGPSNTVIKKITVRVFSKYPDQTYWQCDTDLTQIEWERASQFFTPQKVEPGTTPAGMVAALDALIAMHPVKSSYLGVELANLRAYFWHRRAQETRYE